MGFMRLSWLKRLFPSAAQPHYLCANLSHYPPHLIFTPFFLYFSPSAPRPALFPILIQMNILNQAAIPKGQPVLPFKCSAPQEGTQHVPVGLPNRNLSAIATGDSSQRGAIFKAPAVGFKGQTQATMLEGSINGICNISECDPWTVYFSHSLVEGDKLNLLNDGIERIGRDAPKVNDVLVVSVSSAVKLESKQIELISRKMQKLTGSRNLRLENSIDPSLIAGIIISYDSDGAQVIDLSVKGELATLAARAESSDRRKTIHGQC